MSKTKNLGLFILLIFPSFLFANETKLSSSLSFSVTAVKDGSKIATSAQYGADKPQRIIISLNKTNENRATTALINTPLPLAKKDNAMYYIKLSPAKSRKNDNYTMDVSANKTIFNNVNDLLKPIVLSVNNPSHNGQQANMADLPNGQYTSEMEVLVKHHW